ncbi:enoyl-CoA hydratase/isomerase family protein [Pseudomonas fluorescens]|uniref:Short-chain-enoyl-CoA hydratase n=1 Tax=Pseudomonas fluorescens TaxID=294 RepID=A0A5E7CG51_PSEFL|nr:enoyl-CoA hydratase-related protein [Pseudomonas fluorescens]VVO03717.1 Short-chain-enoyl-CoA hydratase [Pseudomonas fluorescens]
MSLQTAEPPSLTLLKHGRCAVIQINRPRRRNALDLATMTQLVDMIDALNHDPDAWIVMLTGSGDAAFCAGADLKEANDLAASGKGYPTPMTGVVRNVFEAVLESTKPTIAAINGVALGAGLELAMACDIRLAASHARLGLPEAKRGMGANFGSVMLPRLVNRGIALDLLYSGRTVDATEAQRIGLVTQVFAEDVFASKALEYAVELSENAPLTLQRYKQMALKGWEMSIHAALRLNVGPNPYTSEDRAEGVRAFLEKRKPQWQGR